VVQRYSPFRHHLHPAHRTLLLHKLKAIVRQANRIS
jgi:hypothetical protein